MNPDSFDGTETETDSDEIVLDLTGNTGGDFIIPAGDYEVHLTDFDNKPSKEGKPMITWKFQAGPEGKNLRFFNRTVLQGPGAFKLAETVEALGLGKAGEQVRLKRSEAIGRRAIAQVIQTEYEGQKRMEIKKLKLHPKGPVSDDPTPF